VTQYLIITKITHLQSEIRTVRENVLDFSFCDTDSPVTDAYLLIPLTLESKLVLKHTYYRFEGKTPMEMVFSLDFTRTTSAKEK